jgi:CRISPR/Cas system-associated exonuclease Cas4 (RecB family)
MTDRETLLTVLRRSQPSRPSKFGVFQLCPLRYLFETERPVVNLQLPPPPITFLGTAFHAVIQNQAGVSGIGGHAVRELIKAELRRLVTERAGWLAKWVYETSGAEGLIPSSLIDDVTQFTFRQLAASASGRLRSSEDKRAQGPSTSPFGREKWLASSKLDLAGRADLIKLKSAAIHIVDFKLGLSSPDARPSPHHLLQLAAYGILAKELSGIRSVVLELRSPRAQWTQELDTALESSAHALMAEIQSVLPRNQDLEPKLLARTGAHCGSCAYRPSCSAYRHGMVSDHVADKFVVPTDLTGSVHTVTDAGALTHLRLQAQPDGRYVTLANVPKAMLATELAKGTVLSAFGLKTAEVRGRGKFVANFHVFDPFLHRNSAFSCALDLDQ